MLTPNRALLFRLIMSAEPSDAAYIAQHVDPVEFVDAVERRLFIAFVNAAGNQQLVNAPALGNWLRLNDDAAAALFSSIVEIPHDEDDGGDVQALVEVFHEWSSTAKLQAIARTATEQLERSVPAAKVRAEIEGALTSLDLSAIDARHYDDVEAQWEDVKSFLASDGNEGIPFGFAKLDLNTASIVPGNFVVIAGATGTGKSTIARNLVRNWVHGGHRVALMSLEMSAREQWIGFGCMDTGIDVGSALTGTLAPELRAQLGAAVRDCQRGGALRINDRAAVTPEYLLRTLRRYRAEGIDIFVVDHLHRVEYGERNDQQDLRLRVAALARSLKSFAMDTQSVVVALAQLVKKPRTEEPNDSDIRETAQIAEEADKVLFVYRPEVAHERRLDGSLRPIDRSGAEGRRFFASDAPGDSMLAVDDTRVYIKLGKQRIRPRSAIVSIPIDAASGRMFDPAPAQFEVMAS